MPTKAQEIARADLVAELKKLQSDFQSKWIDGSLPTGWNEIPVLHPLNPPKSEITLSLDEDLLKWFRKFGDGFEARINSILRIYWHALQSGLVKSHWDADSVGPKEHTLLEDLLVQKLQEVQSGGGGAYTKKQLAALEKELQASLSTLRKAHGVE